jgi:hypothetical protein
VVIFEPDVRSGIIRSVIAQSAQAFCVGLDLVENLERLVPRGLARPGPTDWRLVDRVPEMNCATNDVDKA